MTAAASEGGDAELQQCRALIAEIVLRTVADVLQCPRGGTQSREQLLQFTQAEAWLFRDDRYLFDQHGITFPEACAILGRDVEDCRRAIRRQMRRGGVDATHCG